MNYVEITLLTIIVSLISSMIGYVLGQRGAVKEKTCLERQSHIQSMFCLQISTLTDSVTKLSLDIKDLKER